MVKEPVVLVVILAALVWFGWSVLWPTYNNFSVVRADYSVWQTKVSDAQNIKGQLASEWQKKYDTLKEQADKASLALPAKEDIPELLTQMEALASQNGLILNSINFGKLKSDKKTVATADDLTAIPSGQVVAPAVDLVAAPEIKKLTVDLQLSGDFWAMKNFLKAAENSLRLMDINSVNFGLAGTGDVTKSEVTNFSVGLLVYYQ